MKIIRKKCLFSYKMQKSAKKSGLEKKIICGGKKPKKGIIRIKMQKKPFAQMIEFW